MKDEIERDSVHDPHQPPQLKSLDLGSLGISGAGEAEALACDIDDPNCEVPGTSDDTGAGIADASEAEVEGERELV